MLEIVTLFSLLPFLFLISSPLLLILTDVPFFLLVFLTSDVVLGTTGAVVLGEGAGGGAGFSTGGGVAGGVAGFTGPPCLHDVSMANDSMLKVKSNFFMI